MKKNENSNKVIDMTERIQRPDFAEYLKGLKVRFDLENTKVAVSTSLLSIVVLVTLANNNMMNTITPVEVIESQSSQGRGIASVSMSSNSPSGAVRPADNPQLIKELANRDLGPSASVGKKPSSLEKLAYGVLEGRYAVLLQDGKLKEIELREGTPLDSKTFENPANFIESQRDLLPTYDRIVKISSDRENSGGNLETFQLVNEISIPVAKVQVHLSEGGQLVALRVSNLRVALK